MTNSDQAATVHHVWQPIAPISEDFTYDFFEIDGLQRQWLAHRQTLEASASTAYEDFLARLTRSWAIETGIIEGLYTLDRGITETLVAQGISVDLIERSSTNKLPADLARILNDHQDAVVGIYEKIKEELPITRISILQLHTVLTRNQQTHTVVDHLGREFEAELIPGELKKWPNNPTRPDDGAIHEYCPPEQVDSELDNLLAYYNAYLQDPDSYHPLLIAAWLHHRFVQIHPFPDGNGRVVRALLTWHLARENYLPIVVTRDDRTRYIAALEKADAGNLAPFVDLMVRLQRRAIEEALVEPVPEPTGLVGQVLAHIVSQVGRRNTEQDARLRSVNDTAQSLRDHAADQLNQQAEQIASQLNQVGINMEPEVINGGPGDKEHWYHREVVESANQSTPRQWVNFNESRFWVRLALNPRSTPEQSRLVFLVSLHHIGRQLSGVMSATAFARVEHYKDPADTNVPENPHTFINCTPPDTFTITNESEYDVDALKHRFAPWTEQALAIALQQWGHYLA